jgi:hypothetical protein
MSVTHQSIIDEYKKKQEENENEIEKLEDELDTLENSLLYSRGLSKEDKTRMENRMKEIIKKIKTLEENNAALKHAKKVSKLATLPSFQERNSSNIDRVFSDPHMLNKMMSFNTGIGGNTRKRTRRNKKSRRNKRNKKSRRNKRSRRK